MRASPVRAIGFAVILLGCSSGSNGTTGRATTGVASATSATASSTSGSTATGSTASGTTSSATGTATGSTSGAAAGSSSSSGSPGSPTCTLPVSPVDTAGATNVVGTGTAASCTEAAFATALAKGGNIVFSCGSAPVTIPITTQHELPNLTTVIDGGGLVTLDGQSATRILHFSGGNYRTTTTTFTIQNLTFVNGLASGTAIPTAACPQSQGTDTTGGGGAIMINDGELVVINSTFKNNTAALLGPDVAGGAIYGTGSLNVTIVGSTFAGNRASNGGAVGALNTTLTLVNDTFTNNQALGNGENSVNSAQQEIGSGGNGGAVVIDGGSTGSVTICGCAFSTNQAYGLGGALFRTNDASAAQPMLVDLSTFSDNQTVVSPTPTCSGEAGDGAGAAYLSACALTFTRSTVSGNQSASGVGGLFIDGATTFTLENDTLTGNSGSFGALFLGYGQGGVLRNVTIAGNTASAFEAAISAVSGGRGTVALQNCLIANQTAGNAVGSNPLDCGAIPPSLSILCTGGADTLQWPGGGNDTDCAPNATLANPGLAALANNGGPTQTLAISAQSPAAAIGTSCPATDQRGTARPATGCAAGAYQP